MRPLADRHARVFAVSQRGASRPIGQPLHDHAWKVDKGERKKKHDRTCCSIQGDEKLDTRALICSSDRASSKSTTPTASSLCPRRDLDLSFRKQLQVCPIGHVVFSLCIPPMDLVSNPSRSYRAPLLPLLAPGRFTTPKGNRGPPPPLSFSRQARAAVDFGWGSLNRGVALLHNTHCPRPPMGDVSKYLDGLTL